MKFSVLAGGVGGAKLANGLSKWLSPDDMAVIVNTGDDFEFLGFYICPDIDTVMYNLAGINNPDTGYGIKDDTFNVIKNLEKLGTESWFHIGDSDIANQIKRTMQLNAGIPLSDIIEETSKALGNTHLIFPMSNEPVRTWVVTNEGESLPFQEYFVKRHFQPEVKQILFKGSEESKLPKKAHEFMESSQLVIICPSNPYVSIDPILSVPGVREILQNKTVVAVSPLISGKTVKGPAAKIMSELGIEVSVTSIARHYQPLIKGIVIDTQDRQETEQISHCGIIPYVTDILMPDTQAQERLAGEVINFSIQLHKESAA